jgi:hypothetical protein
MDYYCLTCSNNYTPPEVDKIYVDVRYFCDNRSITTKLCHLCIDDIIRSSCCFCKQFISKPYQTIYLKKNNLIICSKCYLSKKLGVRRYRYSHSESSDL